MKKIIVIALFFVLLLGCARDRQRIVAVFNNLITKNSVGIIHLGMTVGSALAGYEGRVEFKKNYRAGVSGWVVYADVSKKIMQYVFCYPINEKVSLQSEIKTIEIYDSRYKTSERVYAGMKVVAGVKLFGKATLTFYSSLDNSPEYITFKNLKAENIKFRAKSLTKPEAGKYMQNEGGIIVADKIHADSYIEAIIIGGK